MTGVPLRIGIAGCGRIAERGYLPALRELPGIEPAAVADPNPDRAQRVAELAAAGGTRTKAFTDTARMLDAVPLDGLVVASPAEHHAGTAAQAAAAGVRCLVEKPPAPDLEGARRLAALDPAPAIGFNRRFLQGAELAAGMPAEGWLEMELELRFRRGAWGAHAAHDEALLDAGTHLIDLATFLAGSEPIAVRGAAITQERAEMELEMGRGRARISVATDQRYAERVEVRDRGGVVLGSHRLGGLRSGFAALRGAPQPLVMSLRRQLESFAAMLRGEDAGPLAGAADGVAAMAVVEAAWRSAELAGVEVTVATGVSGRSSAKKAVT